jgi:hypothetical protein
MIDSTSSPDSASRANAVPVELAKRATPYSAGNQRDRLSTAAAEQLQNALADQPEVRPEVVARGRALAADPDYPSTAVIRSVAAMIINSPDLSEDQS